MAPTRRTLIRSVVQNGPFGAGNAVDGDRGTYWESANGAFPQWWQVDLGATGPVARLVLALPAGWEARTQTLAVQGGTDGTTFTTPTGPVGVRFDPATGNQATLTFTATPVRYLRVRFTGNTGWPAGQLAQLSAYAA